MVDTRYRVEIPGGIQIDADVAGPIARGYAYAIDLCLRAIIITLAFLALLPFGAFGMGGGFFLICLFVIEWLYPVLFEVWRAGQTPGKRALGIAVINDDLTPVTLGPSLLRNLLRTIDFLPLFYPLGLVAMLCNRRFQRLGDLAAGTLVISVRHAAKPAATLDLEPLAPPTPLQRVEQISIIDFLQRGAQLSAPRQQELAHILEGITHQPGDDGVERLRRIGAWFLGVR